jgi:transcriptional regulator with XRE-family HTH domain
MQDNSTTRKKELIKALGQIIKEHRERQEKTMYKISAEVGVPKATWREIELGLKDFRFTTIWRIAEGLDIPLDQLIKELQDKLGVGFSLSDL